MSAIISELSWELLVKKVGVTEVNQELDKRTKDIFDTLKDLTSVYSNDKSLVERIEYLKPVWFPARDQYGRTILHLAALTGNTRLVRGLVFGGALINEQDGIGQTPLTLALHKGHANTSKFLVDVGSSVDDTFLDHPVSPLEIAKVKEDSLMIDVITKQIESNNEVFHYISSFFPREETEPIETECDNERESDSFARLLNINVGDQKNTVTIQGCTNRCPDKYSSHIPGGGDFHNRGYINESIARIAGHGGFWHVTERVMKRPTVNPASFKNKFKENNYNNNEEALLDYDDGLSLAMVKMFKQSNFFPTDEELEDCLRQTKSHNQILLTRLGEWISDHSTDAVFQYHSTFVNDLMPITRWCKESTRYGNGISMEGMWMLCPPLYAQVGKTNYRDEAFTQCVNSVAHLPLAYRKMYQQNRTVNLEGKQGKQLAGDEWVEDFLVRPVKQFAHVQSSFAMVELMSCSVNLLEMNRSMYKSRQAFDIHNTKKHHIPSAIYDKLKVAQFAIKEKWFSSNTRKDVLKYSWGDTKCKEGETVPCKYINPLQKGNTKAEKEFKPFLHRKFPNKML